MQNRNRLAFVLGAPDAEMNAIESVLRACGIPHAYAAAYGERCNSHTAYRTDSFLFLRAGLAKPFPLNPFIVTVECGGPALKAYICIDHHRYGDYGFDKGPEDYWLGSSLGQTIKLLTLEGFNEKELLKSINGNPHLIAANDHCPFHAYKGLCPGIAPIKFMNARVRHAASFGGVSEGQVWKAIDQSVKLLKTLPTRLINGIPVRVIAEKIPHMTDAAILIGEPLEYTVESNNNRIKRGITGTIDPTLIECWMTEMKDQLEDLYGCPIRGYAGGYIPR